MRRPAWPGIFAIAAALALSAPVVSAEESPGFASAPATKPAEATERKPFRPLHFELGVRAFAAAVSESADGARDEDVDLTFLRPEIRWEPSEKLRATFEVDLAGNRRITDAFVELRSRRRAGIRVGQFKPPFSGLEMASRWEIPSADRGLLSAVLVDSMGWAGRRPGVEGWIRRSGSMDVAVRLGTFRASHTRGDRIGDEGRDNLREGYSLDSQALFGRIELSRKRGAFGVSGEWRPVEPVPGEGTTRLWAVGSDFTWTPRRKDGGFQVWAEGFYGSSWQDSNAFDGVDTTFVAGRALVAWRLWGARRGRFFFEPYARASALDPDTKIASDLIGEVTGGINAGLRDRLRLNLEVRRESVSRNVPLSLGLEPLAAPSPHLRTAFVVQLGGAF